MADGRRRMRAWISGIDLRVLAVVACVGLELGFAIGMRLMAPTTDDSAPVPLATDQVSAAVPAATVPPGVQVNAAPWEASPVPFGICVHDVSGQVPRPDERVAQVTWTIQDVVGERTDPEARRLASIHDPGASCPIDPPLLRPDVARTNGGAKVSSPLFVTTPGQFSLYLYIVTDDLIQDAHLDSHPYGRKVIQEARHIDTDAFVTLSEAYYLSPSEFRSTEYLGQVLANAFGLNRKQPSQSASTTGVYYAPRP